MHLSEPVIVFLSTNTTCLKVLSHCLFMPSQALLPTSQHRSVWLSLQLCLDLSVTRVYQREYATHIVVVKTSLSGFDVTAIVWLQQGVNVISRYLNYGTIATKPCTQSARSAPAVWLHGLSLHNCGTSTRCCNHMLTSNPERDVSSSTMCVAYSL